MEGEMEFKSVNKGYHALVKPERPDLQQAWREGQTGIPLIDAAMRCLVTTGFVNFRLRAMSGLILHSPVMATLARLYGTFGAKLS